MRVVFLSVLVVAFIAIFATSVHSAGQRCPPHEKYYECGESCQRECSTLNQPCGVMHFRCPNGCYCQDGYARNAQRRCIPISKC